MMFNPKTLRLLIGGGTILASALLTWQGTELSTQAWTLAGGIVGAVFVPRPGEREELAGEILNSVDQ